MSKAGAARKLASAALYGGGGVSVLGAGLYGVLVGEAKLARKAIGPVDLSVLEAVPGDDAARLQAAGAGRDDGSRAVGRRRHDSFD